MGHLGWTMRRLRFAVRHTEDHGIGRQRHHAWPYAEHGHNGPLLPVYVLCHRVVTALQQNARAIAGVENAATRIPPNPSDNHSRS